MIIIGATSGIGKGLALRFVKKGYKVGISGRRQLLLDELLQQFPGNIISSCFDITHANSLSQIDSLIKTLGGVDIFIFCAGIGELSTQPDWDIDEKIIATNVTACTRSCGHLFNYFVKKGSGQIVIISSIAAFRGGSSAPVYNASKAFVSSYAESLNLQAIMLHKDIIITDVKPGFVKTEMAKGGGKFWIMPVNKVCLQIYNAILKKKRTVVVTKRWYFVTFAMKFMPGFIFILLTKRFANKRQ
ncbi:MAG: short-chain dehydrogenase/reductase [Segetibacter sp.]|nr:short-chain dehydrogenase/reductase [Segetibacter sp.]